MELERLIEERFSCKKFKPIKVEEEKLLKILEAGNKAPTATNAQPQRIYVIESEEAINKLNGITRCVYGAKTALLIAYSKENEWKNPLEEGVHAGVEDASIVATFMMLEASNLGVDSCWVNYFANSKLEEAFGLPEDEKSVLLLILGYKEEGVGPLPNHNKKKPLEKTVKRL